MSHPSPLPLLGFANPRGQAPAFLVPLFGTRSDLWIQDGEGKGNFSIALFSPCVVPSDMDLVQSSRHFSAKVGDPLIYAFQFPDGRIEVGERAVIHKVLT